MSYDYDIIILGCGPAGFSAAMQSSKFDKNVVVVEANAEYLGGTWINTGTVPSKSLREAVRVIKKFRRQFGAVNGMKPHERYKMQDLLHYKDKILDSKNSKALRNLEKNEVEVIRGYGKIKEEHVVEVALSDGSVKEISGKYILLCTGSSPIKPTQFELDHKVVLDYKSILNLTHIPSRLVIVGGGTNAIEFATMFSATGTRVSILNENDVFLDFLDDEIRDEMVKILDNTGVDVYNSVNKIEVRENPIRNRKEVAYTQKNSDELHVVETEYVLYLGGKTPNTSNIGLENLNIQVDEEGFIKVDEDYKTNAESVYAVGDIIGFPALASISFSEGRLAVCKMFGIKAFEVPKQVPYGIYSIPEMSNIGLTEKEAIEQGLDITVGRAHYNNITQADISNQQEGLLKIVFDTNTLKIYGIHIIGERASDLIHLGQAVMSLDGDIRYFINHVMNYPTYTEAYRIAAFNGINRVYKAGVKYKKILKNKQKKESDKKD